MLVIIASLFVSACATLETQRMHPMDKLFHYGYLIWYLMPGSVSVPQLSTLGVDSALGKDHDAVDNAPMIPTHASERHSCATAIA